MADTKTTALTGFTPVLTDIGYGVDDPGGTPISGKFTFQSVMDLFEANMTVPSSVSSAYLTSTILASTSNGEGAALIGIEDAGTLITATTVEGALAENRAAIDAVEALLPSGTVVGTTDSQTLSGKTIAGATISADLIPNADGTIALGSPANRFGSISVDSIDLNGTTIDGTALADPGADRLVFWDDSANSTAWLTAGTGLTISDTTITAAPEGTSVLSTGPVTDGYVLTADGAGGAAWEAQAGGGDMSAATYDPATIAEQLVGLTASQTLTNKTLTSPTINTPSIGTSFTFDSVTVTGLTGVDVSVVSGTAGTNGNLVMWNSDGDAVDSTVVAANVVVDGDIGTSVQAYDADTLKADTADQLTAGFTAAVDDDGAAASPYTPDPDTGNYKRVTNDGAMTINGPTMASGESTSMVILLTNTTGAGEITFGTTTDSGDTIGPTTTDEYLIFITAVDVGGTTYSHASVKALQ